MAFLTAPIEIKDTGTPRGRGAFATRAYEQGDLVEIAPVVVMEAEHANAAGIALQSLVFNWPYDENKKLVALVLGCGSIYNHSFPCNLYTSAAGSERVMCFYAMRRIEVGDELTHNYGPGWFDKPGIERHYTPQELAHAALFDGAAVEVPTETDRLRLIRDPHRTEGSLAQA